MIVRFIFSLVKKMNILRVVLSIVMLIYPWLSITLASQVDGLGVVSEWAVDVSWSWETSLWAPIELVSSSIDSWFTSDQIPLTGSSSTDIVSIIYSWTMSTWSIWTWSSWMSLSSYAVLLSTWSDLLFSTWSNTSVSIDSGSTQTESVVTSPSYVSDTPSTPLEMSGWVFSWESLWELVPLLVISEVFVDGTDEWFELTNRWWSLFTGTLVVSGVKASPVTLTNVSLPSGVSRVYGDIMSKIADQSVIAKSGLSLNMTDTAAINVSLSWSGILLDQFQVSSSLVSSYDNEATSFELVNSWWSLMIHPTTVERTRNILSQWIANPGEFDVLSATGSSSTWSTWTNNSWQLSSGAGLLKITEVYFEWVQEWIEISNLWDADWTGSFSLIGANNGTLILSGFTIPALSSVVLADNDIHILDKSVVLVSGLTMILNDLWAIDISLLVWWLPIDRFNVDSSLVTPYVNATNSFERVRYGWQLVITVATGSRAFNIQSGIIANPGKIFSVVDPVIVLDDDDGLDNGLGSGSWTILTGSVFSWSCINTAWFLSIVEVHHADSALPDYVEIVVSTTLSGMRMSWWSWTDEWLSLILWSGQRYVIAASSAWFPIPENVIIIPWFTLSISGGFVVLSRDTQIFDSVVYGWVGGWSLGLTSSDGCLRQFVSSQIPSPGFDERILAYTQIQTVQVVTTNTVYVWWWGWWSCPTITPINTGQICSDFISWSLVSWTNYTGINQTGPNLTGFFLGSGIITSWGISWFIPRILSIDYDPIWSDVWRESIQFSFDGPLPLSLKPYTLHRWSTRKTMNSLVMTSAIQIYTWSRSFPNTPTCITLQSGAVVLDTYCYPVIQTWSLSTWSLSTWSLSTWSLSTWIYVPLKIDTILYDPPGTDRNKETITFSVLDTRLLPVNMSRYTLHRGKTTKKIPSSLSASPQTILANRWFPNRSTCVQLRFDKTIVVDTYCYTVQKKQEPKKSEEIKTVWVVTWQQTLSIPEISIVSLIADPEGSDKDNESITLLLHTPTSFDLSQARLWRGKTTKKINGLLVAGQMLTVTGTFGFPNRDECINLLVDKQIVDTYCYVKSQEPSQEDKKIKTWSIQTWSQEYFLLATGTTASIVAVMPNPKGADKNKEMITFLLIQWESFDLSQTYLQIGTKKVFALSGALELGIEFRQIWSFSLPNKASCIDRKMKGSDQLIDRFCYTQAKDNVIIRKSLSGLEELSEEQVLALWQIGLLKRTKDICATYDGDIIRCRSLPTRAVRLPRTDELRLYQNYISRIHDLIKSDRYPVYAYTPLRQFNDTFDSLKSMISKFQTQVALSDGRQVPIYDLTSVHQDRYGSSYYDRVTQTLGDVILWKDSPPRQRLVAMWYGEEIALTGE